MGSVFLHLALPQYKDAVGVPNRGQPVGNHNDGLAPGEPLKGFLYQRLVLRVGKGGGLVQDEDGGVFQQ